MKSNDVLYLNPGIDPLLERLAAMPGEVVTVTKPFIESMNDEQFKKFCSLKSNFHVNQKAARYVHERLKALGITYDIDHTNKTIKT